MKRFLPFVVILLFAGAGSYLLSNTLAAPLVTSTIDFSTLDDQPNFYHYERSHIKIQRTSGADEQRLAELGIQHERAFVRLDKWKPTLSSQLNTDPGVRYDLGDRYIDSANRRGVSIWITQEVSLWKDGQHDEYFLTPPLNNTELNQYEDVWYEIVRYIKERSPQSTIVEMMNEPDLGKFNLTQDDRWELYIRNANVVNRINTDLNLPNAQYGEKLISGGPSFIFPSHDPQNGGEARFKHWVDNIYAQPNFQEIKPAFYSFHRFGPQGKPERYGYDPQVIREYLDDPKFNGDWDDVPLWVSAYNNYATQTTTSDPSALAYARTAAGVAAVHYQYMEQNVEYGSFFAQSAYNAPEGSVLVPEGQSYEISYYRRGAKTPVYNYFDMMSRIDGLRVDTALQNSSALANGLGVGVDAVRGNNKAWILGWNYHHTGNSTSFDRDVEFDLSGLSAANIANSESASYKIYAIDTVNSNIAHGNHQNDGLAEVASGTLAPGSSRSISFPLEVNQIIMIEIVGQDNSGGSDSVSPSVDWDSPAAHTTLTGSTQLRVTATDNVAIDRVDFVVDSAVVGSDSNTNDNSYSIVFDPSQLSDGNHSFQAVAYDTSGNTTTSSSVTLNVDNSGSGGACSNVTAPDGNIAPNYSYEVPNSQLNPIGSAVYSWPAGDAQSGNCAVQISSDDSSASGVNQRYVVPLGTIAVSPGEELDFSGWVKTTNVSGGADIRVNFWSGSNGSDFIAGSSSVSDSLSGTRNWTELSTNTIVVPANAQFARIELRLDGSGVALFDDVALVRSTGAGGDQTPPSVSLTTQNNILQRGDVLALAAEAADNVGVDRVEFSINGAVEHSVSSAPYVFDWNVNVPSFPNDNYTVTATAFDVSGNQASSGSVTVRVRHPNIDRNGVVGIADLAALLGQWRLENDTVYDLNANGAVDITDLSILLSSWGQ